ncbi:MAG: arginine deiminase-related protein, partial [Saprospiraceae bacterium]
MMEQVTSHVLMIRPAAFGYNAETAENNTFQTKPSEQETASLAKKALAEFDAFVNTLREEGVDVTVVEDSIDSIKPDAVFPNNWISFHDNGTLVTYPMYSKLRRLERREEIVDLIATKFNVVKRDHLEESEKENQFLEGTGSMVLDRVNKIAYACISER